MLGELLGFLGDVLVDMILQPLLGALLVALAWGVHIVFYPLLLGIGWAGAWWKSDNAFGELWRIHGPVELHRLGRQRTLLTAEYSTAGLLIVLAIMGVGAVLYGVGKLFGLQDFHW
ncbi:hypothetical protein [Hymenobacter coccineus]|uniref:Uncharacterized protein n=1 Tax=Hymenobacter coccineus TaxID=1908235 RepID=A0A1G1SR05_9BACT|nr:hypothetical protein [Hymenobacter coccineus]OGX81053.1 hypothetical protein BEN49_16295 [Hymenobacter coccineus]